MEVLLLIIKSKLFHESNIHVNIFLKEQENNERRGNDYLYFEYSLPLDKNRLHDSIV